jgi:hypothetical protein
MSSISDDKLSNRNNIMDDNYYKVNSDTKLLMVRLEIVKKKLNNIPWYRLWTYLKLRKELSCIERETDEIVKRLKRLDDEYMNPIQLVKRP